MNSRFFRRTFVLLAAALLPACQTASGPAPGGRDFPAPAAGWKTSVGQLRYETPARSVIGDAVVSRSGGDFQLDYTAGPGVPLMRLRESGAAARAEGVFAGRGWQGDPARAGGRLASWTALREVFAAVDARRGARPGEIRAPDGSWVAATQGGGRGAGRLSVSFPATRERFVFVTSR